MLEFEPKKVPFFARYAGLLVAMITAVFDMSPGFGKSYTLQFVMEPLFHF